MLVGGWLALTSCNEKLLLEEPTIFVAPENFYQSEQDAITALNGAYGTLQDDWTFDLVGAPVHWGNKGVDELNVPVWVSGGRKEIHLNQLNPTLAPFEELWRGHYRGVNTTNGVIDRVSAMSEDLISPESRDQIVGEARFIRAVLYFSLTKMFGDVPLVTKEVVSLDNINVANTPALEVYEQIIADLQFAESVLSPGQGGGRATQGAAAALLGKVYLQMTGYPLNQPDRFTAAAEQFEKVINSGVYKLLDVYGDVFHYTNDNNDEIIFAIGFEGPGLNEGSTVGSYMGPNGSQENGGGWGTEYINLEFAKSYEDEDVRLAQNVAKINVNSDDVVGEAAWRPWKWQKPKPNNFLYDSPFDFQYLRYADVLLSYAEALNAINNGPTADAYDAINQVRARARGGASPDSVLIDLANLNQEEFVDALVRERRWELCFEGHRKDDLIRMGKFEAVIEAINETQWSSAGSPWPDYQPHERKFPIPTRELDLNPNLQQNPGY